MPSVAPLPALLVEVPTGLEGPDLTRYLAVCGALIGAMLVVALGFRRLFAGRLRARAAKRSLQVVDVLPLGGRQRLVVVRCYDRVFLLGQGEKEVRTVAELDLEAEDLPAPTTLHPPARRDEPFRRVLEAAGGGAHGSAPRATARPSEERGPSLEGGVLG